MDKIRKAALQPSIAENAAPMLLSSLVVSSAAYIYASGDAGAVFLFTVLSVVYAAALFALYEKLRSVGKNWLTTIVVAVVFTAVGAFAPRLADMRGVNDIALWFMEPSRYTQIYYGNTFALILLLGFMLISCLYYFTRVMYRGVFVFLVCLCPFCLFAKTFTEIPVIYPILIMTLFFFIMMNGRSPGSGEALYCPRSELVIPSAAFVLAVTVIASFFPKLDSAPFRENFDEFITGVSIGAPGTADFNDFNNTSSNTTSNDDDTIVFTIYGDNPVYLKRQCFNLYDPENNTWGYYGNYNDGFADWVSYIMFEDPTDLYSALSAEGGEVKSGKCWIRSESGSLRALYTPENIDMLTLYNSERKIYRTELDEYFIGGDRSDRVSSYTLEWYDLAIDTDFAASFTDEYAEKLSEDDDNEASYAADSYIMAKEQAVKYESHLLSDGIMDKCYSSASARNTVRELAKELTADCDSDYSRASALVGYFRGGSYIYDKDFTAPNGFPDTFIMKTKRGACAAYATAMTLMCRELGMTARYCEGFLVQDFDPGANCWYVTAGDAHAFVQVWIDGYGWTNFDPTSSIEDGGYFDITFLFVGAVAALLVAAGALVIFLRPRIEETLYAKKVRASRGIPQYRLVYRKINSVINSYERNRENTLTPTDTAEKSAELFGYDIAAFVQSYENAVYGGYADENADSSAVYSGFMAAYKHKLKEERKNRRKWGFSARRK